MLNDRRMGNRENSQNLDSAIAELNYKIGVRFGGDAKSGVEGLRWVMTRRSAMAFGALVTTIIGTLWYGSVVVHERERKEAERERKDRAGRRSPGHHDGGGGAAGYTTQSREVGTQTTEEKKGDVTDVAYTSLG